jgi:hypothetical protein
VKEVEILCRLAEPYEYVVEAGTANGWSAAWFAQAGKKVITFDPHRRPLLWEHCNGLKHLTDKITPVTGMFHEEVVPYLRDEPTLYFLDGDHRHTGIRRDFKVVKDQKGLFVFHDSNCERGVIVQLQTIKKTGLYDIEYHECERGITSVRKKDA